MKKIGFTLAETLITLGIIGVVASLTLPVLSENYNKKVYATRFKKAYSELYNAIKLSEAYNGISSDWNINFSENQQENSKMFTDKYILPYYKNLKFCSFGRNEPNCGEVYGGNSANYITQNGTGMSFYINENYNGYKFIAVVIDINNSKKPNLFGNDAMTFELSDDGRLVPSGWVDGLTRDDAKNGFENSKGQTVSCESEYINENGKIIYAKRNGCTPLFYLDNFEFKSDYPFK